MGVFFSHEGRCELVASAVHLLALLCLTHLRVDTQVLPCTEGQSEEVWCSSIHKCVVINQNTKLLKGLVRSTLITRPKVKLLPW